MKDSLIKPLINLLIYWLAIGGNVCKSLGCSVNSWV